MGQAGSCDPVLITLLIVVFALTMTLGVPIAFCLGLAGLSFIVLSGTVPIAVLPTLMFGGMDSFPLLAIPFFIIAGDLMQRCGVLPKLIEFANSLVGHLRGGLAYVVVLTSMLFAGVTGVALAECAAIGSMLAPAMVRQGYPGGFVSSVIAGSAVMGPIIPPSVAMLIYAYVYGGGISVGKLFLMGVVPGVLVGLALMALVWVTARQRNFPKSDKRFSLGRVARALRGAVLGLVVPVIILGGILGGVFTPTEAGALAASFAPAAAAYRIDPHHLGLIIVMTVQTALLSPPVALSLYVVASVIQCPMREANREVWKFVAAVLAITLVTALWPAMPLAIPRLFGF